MLGARALERLVAVAGFHDGVVALVERGAHEHAQHGFVVAHEHGRPFARRSWGSSHRVAIGTSSGNVRAATAAPPIRRESWQTADSTSAKRCAASAP